MRKKLRKLSGLRGAKPPDNPPEPPAPARAPSRSHWLGAGAPRRPTLIFFVPPIENLLLRLCNRGIKKICLKYGPPDECFFLVWPSNKKGCAPLLYSETFQIFFCTLKYPF